MAEHLFRLEHPSLSDAALVGFRGDEGLSTCFSMDVFVSLPDPGALDDALDTVATLHFEREPAYTFSGVIVEVELLHEMAERCLARLRLVPKLWFLGLSHHSRMFTEKKIPEIVEQVLTDGGLASGSDFELRLQGSYEKEEHVCQYQESDLAFLSRWLEHEGIFYYFEHEGTAHKLIVTDKAPDESLAPAPIRYHPAPRDVALAGEAFQRFSHTRSVRAKKVALADYDYAKPGLDVSGEADAFASGIAEVRRFADDRFFAPGRGAALAKVRARELMAMQGVHRGATTALHLRAGYCFELDAHPVSGLNKKYRCVAVHHQANLAARTKKLAELTGLDEHETYRATVVAIDAATEYAPPRRAEKPRISGYVTGVIDGPADGDYAQLDADGRYNIMLHFDESGLDKAKASTKVRMMQPHAGNPEGMHFPLRKGTEVLVAFLDGDPDRPLVAGAVPNAHNPSVVTDANYTHNVVHTGGENHFDFEDKKDQQWIWFYSPTEDTYLHLGKPHEKRSHHIVLHTSGNCLFDFGSNQDITVGGKLEETVDGAVTETYSAKQTSTVSGSQTTTVDAATEETYSATQKTLTIGQVTENYSVPHQTTVNAAPRNETFLASQTTTVSGGGLTQQLNGPHDRTVVGAANSTIGGTYTRHFTGAVTQLFGGPVTRLWGPYTATNASLDLLVPGGVNDVHVGYTLVIPADTWSEPATTYVASFKCKIRLLQYAIIGPKAEAIGVNIAGLSIKREATGRAIQVNGASLEVVLGEAEGEAVHNGHWAFCIVP